MNIRHILKRFKEDSLKTFIKRTINYPLYHFDKARKELFYRYVKDTGCKFYRKRVQGSWMFLPVEDEGIGKDLICNSIREEQATKYMQKILSKTDVVVDIGANIGYYALMEARIAMKIYAIEPVLDTALILKSNIAENYYRNITVSNMVIGASSGQVDFHIAEKCNWCRVSKVGEIGETTTIKLPMTTLDIFLKDKRIPNIVRMDVEGYEYEILKGMEQNIRLINYIFIEVHPHLLDKDDTISLLKLLYKNNYRIVLFAKRGKRYEKTIIDLLTDDDFLNGKRGAFQIIFKRGR